mgnify:CR=1 FL=1
MVELEDLVARRDYALKPQLKTNCKCGSVLGLLQSQSTIKQMCKDNYCRKIYPINRKCTFCDTVYDYDEMECKVCDVELTKLTDAEVTLEDNQKLIRRSKRKVKEGKITQKECDDIIKKANIEDEVCEERAREIREKRQIG